MRLVTALACIVLAAASYTPAAAIVRCEAADGKVTYSNADCPPNSRMVRQIDLTPPVVVHDGTAAAGKVGAPRPPARIEPSRSRRADDPAQIDQELSVQLAEQRRECEARAREIQRLQDDVGAARPDSRASAELALRRAQDDYKALCPRQR